MKPIEVYKIFLIIFVFSFITFSAHTLVTKNAIFGDTRFYYAITRSIVKDADINFTNEFEFFGIRMEGNSAGMPINFYPPGVSIFWLSGFWAAETLSRLLPDTVLNDGFGMLHQFGIAAVSIFLGVLGLYFTYLSLCRYFSATTALTATAALFLTTNLFFYIAVEPTTPHSASFFLSSLFVIIFLSGKLDLKNSLILGIVAGVAGIVRTQDAGLLLLPLLKSVINRNTKTLLLIMSGFVLGFIPQMVFWKIFYETFFRSPYMNYGFSFSVPHILYVLFNTQNGFITLTPTVFSALVGLFIFFRKSKEIYLYAIFYLVLQFVVISSWRDYTQGGSYGIRMMITVYPLLSLGYAAFIEKLKSKAGWKSTFLIIAFFSLINFLLIIRYLLMY